jgi:hypothetical protein
LSGEVERIPLVAIMEWQLPFWLVLTSLGFLLMVGPVMAMPPLARVQADNLAAAEILIGQVESVAAAPKDISQLQPDQEGSKVLTLRISHVVKSQARAEVGDKMEVLFRPAEGQSPQAGPLPVQISPGDLVIVYANPLELKGHRFLKPVWAGFSVVRLAPPAKPGETVRFPGIPGQKP